jgi:hypothetical protein
VPPLIPVPLLIPVPSLVPAPLAPASLVPESLAAASPPLAFLALASRVTADVASLVIGFLALAKLVLTFLARHPALISPLSSVAPISLARVSLGPISHVPAVPPLPRPILYAPASAAWTALFHPFPILEMLIAQFVEAGVAGTGRDQDRYPCRDPAIHQKMPSIQIDAQRMT